MPSSNNNSSAGVNEDKPKVVGEASRIIMMGHHDEDAQMNPNSHGSHSGDNSNSTFSLEQATKAGTLSWPLLELPINNIAASAHRWWWVNRTSGSRKHQFERKPAATQERYCCCCCWPPPPPPPLMLTLFYPWPSLFRVPASALQTLSCHGSCRKRLS